MRLVRTGEGNCTATSKDEIGVERWWLAGGGGDWREGRDLMMADGVPEWTAVSPLAYTHSFSPSLDTLLPSFQMAARPPTSHSLRPATSNGGFDPTTDVSADRDTYSQDYSLEEEDESDDGDVFAFLPPSTAEQSPPPQPDFHITSLSHQPHPPPHEYPQYFPANASSPTSPPPPFSSFADPLAYPPPTFIPPTPTHNIPEAGPSTTSVHFVGKVDSPSPPSTTEHRDSDSLSVEDGFRLRKLGNLPASASVASGFTSTSSQIPPDYKRRSTLFHEKRQTSTALSDFSTTDPELDSSSIKYAYYISVPLRLTRSAG
jgi:hypothetical protein